MIHAMSRHSFMITGLILTFSLSFYGISAMNYQVINTVPNSPGGMRFEKEIGIPYTKQVMDQANKFIWSTVFQQNTPAERKPINTVTAYIIKFKETDKPGGVAYMWGESNINFSEAQIASYNYRGPVKWDLKMEFTHVMYHEMTHVLQWGGGGKAPGGLQEGVADFTNIKAGLMQPGFVKPGEGSKWDQGYDNTARFLEYCDKIAPGFVAKLNKKMRTTYDVAFWKELTGKPLEQLWKEYKAKYGGKVANINVTLGLS